MSALIHEKSMKFTTPTQVRNFLIVICPEYINVGKFKDKIIFSKSKNI